MRIRLLIALFVIGSTSLAQTVTSQPDASVTLEKLFARMLKSTIDEEKLRINDSIRLIVRNYASSDSVFVHSFENIRNLGQITSPDSLLKIITWNLFTADGTNKYNLYIIKRAMPGTMNRIYALTGEFSEMPVKTDVLYTESDWYGALYYEVRPLPADDQTFYILLGLSFGNSLVSRKIIDVVSFQEDGTLLFGREWFQAGRTLKYREVIEYGSTAATTLRFFSDRMIVFDHLVPVSPEHVNDRRYYVPDYSYDAYEYLNGLWRLRLNVDVRNKQ